jgi:hypothetical protein
VRRPAAINGVTVEKLPANLARLHWPASTFAADYAITRGSLSALSSGDYGACLASSVAVLEYDDATVPAPDAGFAYLIQGRSATCGLGSAGNRGNETVRTNINPGACP